jgi:hypothetical protein
MGRSLLCVRFLGLWFRLDRFVPPSTQVHSIIAVITLASPTG